MKALLIEPGRPDSVGLEDIREPAASDGALLVSSLALGVCGTDDDLVAGKYGSPPSGHKRLVIGHESLGVVDEAPEDSPVRPGDIVIPFVRVPDPEPCECCAAGQWDRCLNDGFTEHGIKSLDGFGRERYRVAPDRVVVADRSLGITAVLGEPASVVAKAWEIIDNFTVGACWESRRVLVTGAGPVGLLAALLGRQRGLDVHVFDRNASGPKPTLTRDLGATYHHGELGDLPANFDVVLECTGAAAVVAAVAATTRPNGVICLLGVAGGPSHVTMDTANLNDTLVMGNRVMLGSVNANRAHFKAGHQALLTADRGWLERLLTRRVPFAQAADAFQPVRGDVKTVIVFDRARDILS